MQSDKQYTFHDFKIALRNFEENEKVLNKDSDNSRVMQLRHGNNNNKVFCYHCNTEGHRANACPNKPIYCSHCKKNTHKTADKNKNSNKNRNDNVKTASATSSSFNFMVDDNAVEEETEDIVEEVGQNDENVEINDESQMACKTDTAVEDLLVDSGCTSHISNDESNFTEFDSTFKPEHHSLTLADGTKCSGMAEKRGKVEVSFTDTNGVDHDVTLHDVLYIPTYP